MLLCLGALALTYRVFTRARMDGRRTAARIAPVALAALALCACASNPANADSATPGRVARIRHACGVTMGLDPSGAEFQACTISLEQTMAAMDQAALVQADRKACMDQALQPGTPAFALCVVGRE